MRIITLTLLAVLILGCSKKEKPETPETLSSEEATFSLPQDTHVDPSFILADVNGARLTVGDANVETRLRIQGAEGQIPPNVMAGVRDRTIDNFILRTVLCQEAEANGMDASEEELTEALDQVAKNLPPELSIEKFLNESIMGREKILNQIKSEIKINKLLKSKIEGKSEIPETEIDEFIKAHEDALKIPETVKARHILLETSAEATEEELTEKKQKAEKIRAQLQGGADFEALAQEFSDCPSRERGGDLGTFSRDRMVKEFSDAAFALKPMDISPVVKTDYGYHIIQVTEKQQAGIPPREQIKEIMQGQKNKERFNLYAGELMQKANIRDYRQSPVDPATLEQDKPSDSVPNIESVPEDENQDEK